MPTSRSGLTFLLWQSTRPRTVALSIGLLAIIATPALAGHAHAFSYDINYPTTNTNGTGYAFLQDPLTGVSVTLTGSDPNVSFGLMAQKFSHPRNVGTPNLSNPEYYGIVLLGVSFGNAEICMHDANSSQATTMAYFSAGAWTEFSNVTIGSNQVCGNVSVDSFMDNTFATSYIITVVGDALQK